MVKRRPDQKQYDVTTVGNWPSLNTMITGPIAKKMDLKYARNPGYTGAFYVDAVMITGPCIANAEVIKAKKDPGYINIEDGSRAIRVARKIHEVFPAYVSACITKHEIPGGAGRGNSSYEAFLNAWNGDPLSNFGGCVALSKEVDKETALAMKDRTPIEWVFAPGYSDEAMDILNKTSIRLMRLPSFDIPYNGVQIEVRDVDGGYLVGEKYDTKIVSPEFIEVKFGNPSMEDYHASILNWIIAGETKSNSVCVGDQWRTYGNGSGQQSRVDSAMLAMLKACGRDFGKLLGEEKWASELVGASDAFWPFPDGPEILAKAGVRGCIYPTGGNRDEEVIEVFRKHDMFVMIPRPEPENKDITERAFY